MAFERSWAVVAPRLFTSDGGTLGQIQISDTRGIKVKQKIVIAATSLPNLNLEVKRVISNTQFLVGPIGQPISSRSDLSAYTTALSAYVYAEEQAKSKVVQEDREYATYEGEPANAWRNVLVDQQGSFYEPSNPLPVSKINSLIKSQYDEILMVYDAYSNLTTATYKFQGNLVNIITLTYDSNFNITNLVVT